MTSQTSAPEAQNILQKYDISGIFAQKLNMLQGFKIVLICDDSTSMRDILAHGQTKWDELKHSVEIVLDVANAYQVDCDVLFLNCMGLRNVKNISQLNEQFSQQPQGYTPLTKTFNLAIENNRMELNERKLLILIFTDGSPTAQNLTSEAAIQEFYNTLRYRQPIDKLFVSIIACTDDEYAIGYLNDWDNKIPNLDVVDDYQSEKKQIYKAKRIKTAFTFGDYISKILLGSFIKEIDKLDEPRKKKCTII